MHLVVIGGTGFIGRHFLAAALGKGHRVTIVSREHHVSDPLTGDFEFLPGGIRALAEAHDLLAKADCICHFATSTTPASSAKNPIADVEGNLVESVRLMEAMRHSGNRRIVFLSSGGAVYGRPQYLPIDEDHRLNPISSYGVVKASIEQYLRLYEATQDFRATIIRLANPYGPGQTSIGQLGAVNTFVSLALRGEVATIRGDGSAVRDYVYISDVIALLIAAVESDVSGTFNCGTGVGTSLLDLVRLVEHATGRPLRHDFLPPRAFDPPKVVLDIARAEQDFGWRPRVLLQDGIAQTTAADTAAGRT